MSLLSAVNEACDVLKMPRFDTIAAASDENSQAMLTLATEAGEEIARRADWQRMLRLGTLAASGSPLPADFQRLTPGGGIVSALGVFIRPITNSSEWTLLGASLPSAPYYFIRSNAIEVLPASAGTNASFTYVSRYFAATAAGAPLPGWTADDNTMAFPERLLVRNLVWRWKRDKGAVYDDELAEFEGALSFEIQADRGAT